MRWAAFLALLALQSPTVEPVPATSAGIGLVQAVAVARSGDVYLASRGSGRQALLLGLSPDGRLRVVGPGSSPSSWQITGRLPYEAPFDAPPAVQVKTRPATFLFYFDQPHLTQAGRARAIGMAREMAPKLIRDGNRGIVVSDARRLEIREGPTTDAARIVAALDRLEKDPAQWDSYAFEEDSRVAEVVDILNDRMGGVSMAMARARSFQLEEAWRLERSVAHAEIALQALADIDPPKAFVLFSDTLRARPGDHYLQMFSSTAAKEVDGAKGIATHLARGAEFGELTVDRLLNTASSLGVRFYTIEAQGLVSSLDSAAPSFDGSFGANNATIPQSLRIRQAQDTLGSMAAETGGRSFLNGVPAVKIVSSIESDLSCVFLVSFDPTGLPEDRPLPVIVKVNKPGVKVRGRGRLLIESESARKTSRLLAAFANAGGAPETSPLRVSVVPSGFKDGVYGGLVQVSVPPSPYPNASWDLGFSIVGGEKVRDAVSTRISVPAPGAPIVLERETTFPPAPFEIVAVGRETSTEQIVSQQYEGTWPTLRD